MIIKKILSVVLSIIMGLGILPSESVKVFTDSVADAKKDFTVTEDATAPSKNSAGEYVLSTADHLI